MALWSCACQSLCVNTLVDLARGLHELAGTQGLTKRSNAESNKALIFPEASTSSFVPLISKDLFTIFIKVFMETTQAQAQALAERWECSLKTRTPETYWGKSYIECYHFCQQSENHFEISGASGMNRTPFAASFLCGSITLRWAQHKRRHKSATLIT